MLICGYQKLTLLDFPGKLACTVFTGGCSFRCPFCHNPSLVLPELLTEDSDEAAVLAFLEKRRGVLDGVAVTGGEPLLQRDIRPFLEKLRDMGYSVKLDTNGSFPDRLIELVNARLVDKVAMDIKNSPEEYARTIGLPQADMAAIERSKDFLLGGSVDYEFRTTAVKGLHTRESIAAAAKWIAGAKEYYLQQFRNSGELLEPQGLEAFDGDEMRALAEAAAKYVPSVQLRGLA